MVNGVNSTSYVKTAGALTLLFFIHMHTLLTFANVLNQDTKMLAACKHENPHLRSLRQDVQLKCLNTLSLLSGETCIREGWLTAVWLLVLRVGMVFFGSYEALQYCCLLPLQYLSKMKCELVMSVANIHILWLGIQVSLRNKCKC